MIDFNIITGKIKQNKAINKIYSDEKNIQFLYKGPPYFPLLFKLQYLKDTKENGKKTKCKNEIEVHWGLKLILQNTKVGCKPDKT